MAQTPAPRRKEAIPRNLAGGKIEALCNLIKGGDKPHRETVVHPGHFQPEILDAQPV